MADPRQNAFWQDAGTELVDELTELLIDTYMQGVDGGVQTMPPNLRALLNLDTVNMNAVNFAKSYRLWIDKITETTRVQVQTAISNWIQSGASLDALDKTLEPVFGKARAEQIAATEVTRIFAQANMESWEATGMVDGATWMTSQDEVVCPECDANDGMEVGLGDIDAAPPAHPGCRCWLQPHTSDELIRQALEAE